MLFDQEKILDSIYRYVAYVRPIDSRQPRPIKPLNSTGAHVYSQLKVMLDVFDVLHASVPRTSLSLDTIPIIPYACPVTDYIPPALVKLLFYLAECEGHDSSWLSH